MLGSGCFQTTKGYSSGSSVRGKRRANGWILKLLLGHTVSVPHGENQDPCATIWVSSFTHRECKSCLKAQHSETKITAPGPITSWKIDGETVETVADFIFGGSQNDSHHKWRKIMRLPHQHKMRPFVPAEPREQSGVPSEN